MFNNVKRFNKNTTILAILEIIEKIDVAYISLWKDIEHTSLNKNYDNIKLNDKDNKLTKEILECQYNKIKFFYFFFT